MISERKKRPSSLMLASSRIPENELSKGRVCVLVLGDFGRSPRMQYHTLSFAREGYSVDVIGYGGSLPSNEILMNDNVTIHKMKAPPAFDKVLPRMLSYALKVFWQSITLFLALLWVNRPSTILVQNPPSVPMLPVTWFACKLKRSSLVIDWHNYGHSILALTLGRKHVLVKVSEAIERLFGRTAVANLCVTEAMRMDLEKNWKIRANVLYDRPAASFRPAPLPDRHALFMRLREHYPVLASTGPDTNLITERFADGRVNLRGDRPGLVVSSTSWTEDENFDLLLDAMEFYNRLRNDSPNKYPPLLVVITGKGPLKAHYEALIMLKDWQNVEICTVWLETEDYPKLLASADLGVCLHTSSSGLDLPMKVVDMFGCGLPVAAYKFPCIGELVKHGENGLVFETSQELGYQIASWFEGFPEKSPSEYYFRRNLEAFEKVRWHENWTSNALPILSRLSETR